MLAKTLVLGPLGLCLILSPSRRMSHSMKETLTPHVIIPVYGLLILTAVLTNDQYGGIALPVYEKVH